MKRFWVLAILGAQLLTAAESKGEKGKRLVQECLDALGGDRYLHMTDRVQSGRSYSFYREQVTGFSITKMYVRYRGDVTDTANQLAVEERDYFGKKADSSILFDAKQAWELTFRGARPISAERFERYRETTLRDVFYILRVRLKEPGMQFDWRGSDVLNNRPVEIVEIIDGQNRITTVYLDQTTKVPVRQRFERRDAQTKEKNEEITEFSKYRDIGGVQWPFDVHRERNGEKIYEMFSEAGDANKGTSDDRFSLPGSIKLLKTQ